MNTAMRLPRVMPCLLIQNGALVKTIRFKNPSYVGDPLNAVRIFNEMEVDELVLLDIGATASGKGPDLKMIREFAGECFMPLAYGGGIRCLDDIRAIFAIGVEKAIINTFAHENPSFIRDTASEFGSQSILVSIDVKRNALGKYEAYTNSGTKNTRRSPVDCARLMKQAGAGELLVSSIDRDGTWSGYDLDMIRSVASAVDIPVIACGGAGKIEDFGDAVYGAGASAVAAGSLFVYQKKGMGVLVNFPSRERLTELFRKVSHD